MDTAATVKQCRDTVPLLTCRAAIKTDLTPPRDSDFKLLLVCSSNTLNKSLFRWQVDNEITHRRQCGKWAGGEGPAESGEREMRDGG